MDLLILDNHLVDEQPNIGLAQGRVFTSESVAEQDSKSAAAGFQLQLQTFSIRGERGNASSMVAQALSKIAFGRRGKSLLYQLVEAVQRSQATAPKARGRGAGTSAARSCKCLSSSMSTFDRLRSLAARGCSLRICRLHYRLIAKR